MSKSRLKRKSVKGKLLIFGSLLFSFGLITSVTTTVAYYSIRTMSMVDNINLTIDMSDATLELYLSTDKGLIHNPDGYTKEELGIEGIVLGDVSGMFESSWLNEDTDMLNALPTFRKNYQLSPSVTITDDADKDIYVQNVFYFKAGRDCYVYLDESTLIQANTESNKIVAEREHRDFDKLNSVVNAVRVSFFTEDGYIIANPGESGETLYGGILDLRCDGYYDYIDDKEILFGEYEGEPTYLPADDEEVAPYENGSVFVSNHKAGVQKVNLDDANQKIKKEDAYKLDDLRYKASDPLRKVPPICHVKKGEMKRIVVSIYVEGWDRHMTNDIDKACFDANIAFTALF